MSLASQNSLLLCYLRYGGYGKDAAPLAAHMVKKWREIKQKYHRSITN